MTAEENTTVFQYEAEARDWPGDFPHDNGNYMNTCHACGNTFTGYKRRIICRVCSDQAPKVEGIQAQTL